MATDEELLAWAIRIIVTNEPNGAKYVTYPACPDCGAESHAGEPQGNRETNCEIRKFLEAARAAGKKVPIGD